MVSIVQQPVPTESHKLLRRMHDKILAFQALLIEEQQAIRTLSFGQFTTITMRKTQLLDEIRELEQSRRSLPAATGHQESSASFRQQEAELAAATSIWRRDYCRSAKQKTKAVNARSRSIPRLWTRLSG